MTKYYQVRSVAGKFSEWMFPGRSHKMACCDCGLVHDMQFRAVKVLGKGSTAAALRYTAMPKGHAVVFRARRNEKATTAKRRENRKKKK